MMTLEERLALVPGLLDLATNGDTGRSERDELYQRVTERRDTGKAYSSCGDLCHWLLFRLGVRLPFVNRAEGAGWKPGMNISRLCFCPAAKDFRKDEQYAPGDILAVWNLKSTADAHVLVVREHFFRDCIVNSADYGQPGGARRSRGLSGQLLGGKKIMKVVKLRKVLELAETAGALVDAQSAQQWLSGGDVA